ncbi:NAD(P)-dependent oxidoreductase [Streptomyces sp. O3]
MTGEGLQVRTADLSDPEALGSAVSGRDAVLSGLGARGMRDARAGIATRLTRPVLQALDMEGARRFLAVSAAPLAPQPKDQTLVQRRVVGPLVGTLLRPVYTDLARMEECVGRSATNWTLVRPPKLLNRPLTRAYRTAYNENLRGGGIIGRADVAHAMLAMIDDPAAF